MTREYLKRCLAVVSAIIVIVATFCCVALPSFATDSSPYPPRVAMEPSTRLESIKIDFYITGTDEDFTVLFDAPSFFYGGQGTYYRTELTRSPYKYILSGDILRGGTGAYSQLLAYYLYLTVYNGTDVIDCTISKITLYYSGSVVHDSDTGLNFVRPYDGNFDATILIPNNAPYSSVLTFTQQRFVYRHYVGEYYDYMFTEPQITEYTHVNTGVGGYCPIGVRSSYGTKNQSVLYQDGSITLQDLPVSCEWFRVLSAEQVITFTQGISTNLPFYITDQYTELIVGEDGKMLEPTTNVDPVDDTFEVGSFLRDSVNAFFQLEIFDGFTFSHLFWLVIGVSVLVSLALFLAGK